MTDGFRSIPDPRPLGPEERALLHWLLLNGGEGAADYLEAVDELRVVSRCGCGCASVDFVESSDGGMQKLSDYQYRDDDGNLCGVFVFARRGKLAGLEVWSIDGAITPTTLPRVETLEPLL